MHRSHVVYGTAVACTALFSLACSSAVSPYGDLRGTWAQEESIAGNSLVITLSQSGSGVIGWGTYSGEAGPSGTVAVRGDVHAPAGGATDGPTIDLSLTFTQSLPTAGLVHAESFTGKLLDASHMIGVLAADTSGAPGFSATFVHQ